jgi:hypothetical protein
MTISRLLLTSGPKSLLLGELYRFPPAANITLFLRVHHLTLAKGNHEKITAVAKCLQDLKGQSTRDISNVVTRFGASEMTFVPALIDCANAMSIWAYKPSNQDQITLRNFGWNV